MTIMRYNATCTLTRYTTENEWHEKSNGTSNTYQCRYYEGEVQLKVGDQIIVFTAYIEVSPTVEVLVGDTIQVNSKTYAVQHIRDIFGRSVSLKKQVYLQ